MRCPDCNKFVPFEQNEPEVELDITDERDQEVEKGTEVQVTAQVRLVLACAECGTELKEANLEAEEMVTIEGHLGDDHVLSVEDDGSDTTDRYDGKEGTPMRYRKHFYGATIEYKVTCSCDQALDATGSLEVEEMASGFDELV